MASIHQGILGFCPCGKACYPDMAATKPDVESHAHWALSCAKCKEGMPFAAYKCLQAGHIHVGHDKWRKEQMATTTGPTPIRAGDRWVATIRAGAGQEVEIVRTNGITVQFKALGRGADQSRPLKAPVDLFRRSYAPVKLADRQERPARLEKEGTPMIPGPIVAMTVPAEAPKPVEQAPKPALDDEKAREIYQLAHTGTPLQEIATTYGVSMETVRGIWLGEQYAEATADLRNPPPAVPPPAPTTERPKPRGNGQPPALTRDEVRDIWRRREAGGSAAVLGRTYNVSERLIRAIHHGENYAAHTADLRQSQPAPAPTPETVEARKGKGSGTPRKLTPEQACEIYRLRQQGMKYREIEKRFPISQYTINQIVYGKAYAAETAELRNQPAPEKKQEEAAPMVTTPEQILQRPQDTSAREGTIHMRLGQDVPAIVTDLADALEVMLDYAGKPLPRYLRIDTDALRGLISRARSA